MRFLEVFYNATMELLGIYYATSHLSISQLYAMSITFAKQYENVKFKPICESMESKFKRY